VDPISNALDNAGETLKALGEDSVLLAFYRAGADFPEDRFTVRLALHGSSTGVQESAATPSAAFAKALAARAGRRAALAVETAARAEIAARLRSPGL